jgi:hypothetical protein
MLLPKSLAFSPAAAQDALSLMLSSCGVQSIRTL